MSDERTCEACSGTGFNPRVVEDLDTEATMRRKGEVTFRTICVICRGTGRVQVTAHGK